MRRDPRNSHHLATVSFDGRFWDAYLELVDAPSPGQPARGRIAFSAADAGDAEPVRTTTIFIEDTAQDVLSRAREFKTHQLVALLRSAIPPDMELAPASPTGGTEAVRESQSTGGAGPDTAGNAGGSDATAPEGQGDAADGP